MNRSRITAAQEDRHYRGDCSGAMARVLHDYRLTIPRRRRDRRHNEWVSRRHRSRTVCDKKGTRAECEANHNSLKKGEHCIAHRWTRGFRRASGERCPLCACSRPFQQVSQHQMSHQVPKQTRQRRSKHRGRPHLSPGTIKRHMPTTTQSYWQRHLMSPAHVSKPLCHTKATRSSTLATQRSCTELCD